MRLLLIGDVVGKPGRHIVCRAMRGLIQAHGLDLGCPFSRSPKRLAASPPVLHAGGAAIGTPPQGEGSPPLEPLRRTPQRRARPESAPPPPSPKPSLLSPRLPALALPPPPR